MVFIFEIKDGWNEFGLVWYTVNESVFTQNHLLVLSKNSSSKDLLLYFIELIKKKLDQGGVHK